MTWDPFGTLAQTLWIGGGQWAGKSTVARLLAQRLGLTCYHYDYPDARGHWDRRVAAALTNDRPAPVVDPESWFVRQTPQQSAEFTLGTFIERFEYTLDDLRALVSGRPILAEGWGLRPQLVAEIAPSLQQVVVMVPSAEFRAHQLATLPRAGQLSYAVSDPELAVRNRMERDRIVAQDAVNQANRLGIRVIEVDGTRAAESVADLVAEHFSAHLAAFSS
ncbi:hypothetical protein Rhe02_14300 [Rhizocola hellebori]|uniref:Uncharacterized protein n=1 Tax=Rhizocola hellebori TaxID=1392758 RepID=A0A8J3Q3P8_9ACTN|nr:hypothetical protein [Rhizocola hellebori]GIH03363.1 hypothetical protein Rhe02_14300 [Rhizocola hellebori]